MSKNPFYTATMAKVYADQGHFKESAEIYRHLLSREPHREDLQAALLEVNQKLEAKEEQIINNIPELFNKWINLLLQYHNWQKLKKLQNRALNRPQKRV